ncbi:MAG: hypothetical protein ACKO5P_05920 [Nodosilinea sp.]|jgi:hypothetical protein
MSGSDSPAVGLGKPRERMGFLCRRLRLELDAMEFPQAPLMDQ